MLSWEGSKVSSPCHPRPAPPATSHKFVHLISGRCMLPLSCRANKLYLNLFTCCYRSGILCRPSTMIPGSAWEHGTPTRLGCFKFADGKKCNNKIKCHALLWSAASVGRCGSAVDVRTFRFFPTNHPCTFRGQPCTGF